MCAPYAQYGAKLMRRGGTPGLSEIKEVPMEFFFGMLGAGVGLVLYHAGVRRGRGEQRPGPATVETQEARRMQEGQEAFRILQNYSAERAYGMARSEEVT